MDKKLKDILELTFRAQDNRTGEAGPYCLDDEEIKFYAAEIDLVTSLDQIGARAVAAGRHISRCGWCLSRFREVEKERNTGPIFHAARVFRESWNNPKALWKVLLNREENPSWIRVMAVDYLAELNDPGSIKLFKRLSTDESEDPDVREACAKAEGVISRLWNVIVTETAWRLGIAADAIKSLGSARIMLPRQPHFARAAAVVEEIEPDVLYEGDLSKDISFTITLKGDRHFLNLQTPDLTLDKRELHFEVWVKIPDPNLLEEELHEIIPTLIEDGDEDEVPWEPPKELAFEGSVFMYKRSNDVVYGSTELDIDLVLDLEEGAEIWVYERE